MTPLFDRIIVKRTQKEDVSIGGIALVGKVADTLERGVILAVGPGRRTPDGKTVPMSLKKGDRVIFEKPPYPLHVLAGEEVFIMYESEVIGVI